MSHVSREEILARATRIGAHLRQLQAEVDTLVMDLTVTSRPDEPLVMDPGGRPLTEVPNPPGDGFTGRPVAIWLLEGLRAGHFKIVRGDNPLTDAVQLGWIDADNIWLSPNAITEALNYRALKSQPTTTRAVGRALLDSGFLQPGPQDPSGARRVTHQVRIGNQRPRVWKPTREFAAKIQEAREESLRTAIAKSPPDEAYWAEYADFARLDVEPPS